MAIEELRLRRRGRPYAFSLLEGWRSQAVLGQPATRKSLLARGPRCRARARGVELAGDGEVVAAATVPQVGGSLGGC